MKKTTKLFSIMIAMLIVLSSLPSFAVYEEQILFSDASYYSDENLESSIGAPVKGTFYVAADAAYEGEKERNAVMMFVFYDEATGVISKAVPSNVASWPGKETQTLKAKVEVESIDNLSYKVYFLDDFARHTPLSNVAPTAPGEIEISDVTETDAVISFGEAEDDFNDVKGYNIYKDGVFQGSTTELTFELGKLLRNKEVEVEVKAKDASLEGSVGMKKVFSPKLFPVTEITPTSAPDKDIDIAGDRLTFIYTDSGAGSSTYGGKVAGRDCAVFEVKYPGFKVNTDYISSEDDKLVFELTYFDKATKNTPIYFQSNKWDSDAKKEVALSALYIENPNDPEGEPVSANAYPNYISAKENGAGVWKTIVRTFVNCYYDSDGAGAGEKYKHFRMYTTSGTAPVYITRASISKPEDYVPMKPNVTVDGGMIVYGLNFAVSGGWNVAYTVENVGGVEYAKSLTNEGLKFTSDDKALSDADNVVVELSFLDDEEDTLYVSGKSIAMTGKGKGGASVELTKAELASGITVTRASGKSVYLSSLQAYAKAK